MKTWAERLQEERRSVTRSNGITESERRSLRRYWDDPEVTISQMERQMGRARPTLLKAAEEMGLPPRAKRTPSSVGAQMKRGGR